MIEPLRIEFEVQCEPHHAFATWTERIDQWWPRGHTVSGDAADVVLEPRVGGRVFERTSDGREIDWGEITDWAPPHPVAYLWHILRDRADATDVEISYAAAGDRATRVVITHSGWVRLGAEGPGWRDANRGGWSGLLPAYVAAVDDQSE